MTEVRVFKAASMQEALAVVHREMGKDAVILHTRQVAQRRLLPWLKRKEEVEITAGIGINVRSSRHRTSDRQQVSAEPEDERDSRRLDNLDTSGGIDLEGDTEAYLKESDRSEDVSFFDSSTNGDVPSSASDINRTQASALQSRLDATVDVASQLESIHKMVANLERVRHVDGAREIPSELFYLYTELIYADVEEELTRELIFRLKKEGTPEQLQDTEAVRALLTATVESEIECTDPIFPQPGRRKVVALVGPTGVGKTTTIAKLAANFRLRDGVKMGLVTVDTYRIAAVEQLRTYAEIIDLPMKVVTSPPEMRRALDELAGLDLVLIDTAGRSPRDDLQIQELKSLLSEADVDEVHLVMSLTASLRSIEATAEKFAAASTTSMILTKLDEAAEMGTLLSVSRKVQLPISYLTTGQDVPDDIEPANASRIARLVLGQDKLIV